MAPNWFTKTIVHCICLNCIRVFVCLLFFIGSFAHTLNKFGYCWFFSSLIFSVIMINFRSKVLNTLLLPHTHTHCEKMFDWEKKEAIICLSHWKYTRPLLWIRIESKSNIWLICVCVYLMYVTLLCWFE